MAISGDYARPVTVNGFSCKNCTEVAEATKHIDPAHPKDGPYGVNAKDQSASSRGPAVILGHRFAPPSHAAQSSQQAVATQAVRLDIFV